MDNNLTVSYNIGMSGAAKDNSRLQIIGSKNGVEVLKTDVDIVQSRGKAALYNTVGFVWMKMKNAFSSKSSEVMVRRKYIPLTITNANGKEKVVFVNVNSLMKNVLDLKSRNREDKLGEAGKVYGSIIEGLSTDSLLEQGQEIQQLVAGMVKKNVDAKDRRVQVAALVSRPITQEASQAIKLDPFKPLAYYPSEHSQGEKYEKLCKARMGLSGTATGQTGESTKSRENWEKADRLVAGWAEKREPLTPSKVLEINHVLCDGLANNGGQAGVLRKPGQDIRAGASSYLAGAHVEQEMDQFMQWLEKGMLDCDNGKMSPVLLGAQAFQRLVSIHPFRDGNGRTTRLVMDYILQRYSLPPPAIKDPDLAVFGGRDKNIDCDHAVLVVKSGIEESCRHLEVESPFVTQ